MKLTSETTKSNHAAAAAAIRAELKRRGIAGTVRGRGYSGGNSVNVTVTDLPPREAIALKVFCWDYQVGSFDGATDCYEYSNRSDDLPQVKFVFVTNQISGGMFVRIWGYCRSHYGLQSLYPSDYIPAMECRGEELIMKVFNGIVSDFWSA